MTPRDPQPDPVPVHAPPADLEADAAADDGAVDPQALARVKDILRRDLKLGDDFSFTDDMPLVGSDLDLDSLDFLMLVTSVEKDLGYKIPNQDIGPEIFTSVRSFADYLDGKI